MKQMDDIVQGKAKAARPFDVLPSSTQAIESVVDRRLSVGAAISAIRLCEEISQVKWAKHLEVSKQYLCD
jgi:DNA-binding transcriptional regulator YiaG